MKQEESEVNVGKLVVFGVIALILLVGLFSSFYQINAGQRGVLLTFGKPDMTAKTEGLHFKIPMIQNVIKFDIKTQKYEVQKASAASKDLQTVTTDVTINYYVNPENVPEIYQKIGINYQDKVIAPAVQEVVKASTAAYTAEELITKRPEVKEKIDLLLTERLRTWNIIVQSVAITNFDFSEEFNRAIESKVTAEQNALAAKNKLEQIKYEAQQAIEAANGKAQALEVEGNALRNNPQIANLRAIEKWDGKLPLVTGNAIPLINLNQLNNSI